MTHILGWIVLCAIILGINALMGVALYDAHRPLKIDPRDRA